MPVRRMTALLVMLAIAVAGRGLFADEVEVETVSFENVPEDLCGQLPIHGAGIGRATRTNGGR